MLAGACLAAAVVPAAWANSVGIENGASATSIQQAVDLATNGDVILISTGIFYESVCVAAKDLTFRGAFDEALSNQVPGGYTEVNAQGLGSNVFTFLSSSSRLERLYLVGGEAPDSSDWSGGGAYLSNAWVEFDACGICSNRAWWGAGLFVATDACARLTGDTVLSGNLATDDGGGAYVRGVLRIAGGEISGNFADDGCGGGVYLTNGRLEAAQALLAGNTASGGTVQGRSYGGGVYVVNAYFEAGSGTVVSANTADYGGGIALAWATATLGYASAADLTVATNSAGYDGGGLFATNSRVSLGGTAWRLNMATNYANGCGGGACLYEVYIESDTNGSVFDANRAAFEGGALYLGWSTGAMTAVECGSSTDMGNRAAGGGGAIYMQDSVLTLYGGHFAGNRSDSYGGGAIFADGGVVVITNGAGTYTATVFEANSAPDPNTGYGGTLYVQSSSGTNAVYWAEFVSNNAYAGGAVFVNDGAFVSRHVHARENTASYGGALFLGSYSFWNGGEDIIEDNHATISGAGIYCTQAGADLLEEDVSRNRADWRGGGIYCGYGSFARVGTGSVFNLNEAGGSGGAMYVADSTVEVYCAKFGENAALGNRACTNGGAIYLTNALLEVHGGFFAGNRATNVYFGNGSCGGALLCNVSRLYVTNDPGAPQGLSNTTFEANAAATDGGGAGGAVCVCGVSTDVYFHQALMISNTAQYGGGLAVVQTSACHLSACCFDADCAGVDGGGAWVKQARAVFSDCGFSGCTASNGGGGIQAAEDATVEVAAGRFEGNAADHGAGVSGWLAQQLDVYCPTSLLAAGRRPLLFCVNTAEVGAAVFLYASPAASVSHAVMVSNRVVTGGRAVYCNESHLELQHAAIIANASSSSAARAVAFFGSTGTVAFCTLLSTNTTALLYVQDSVLAVSNSIFWQLVPDYVGHTAVILTNGTVSMSVAYCDVDGGWQGTGTLDTNPAVYADGHLKQCSPCIDSGGALAAGALLDIDGEVRDAACDIGSDEFTDSDGDILPDAVETDAGSWNGETDTGTDPHNPDSDGDGLPDGEEWIADTDPTDPGSFLHMTAIAFSGNYVRVSWVGGTAATQVLEWETNLQSDAWTEAQTYTPPTPRSNSAVLFLPTDAVLRVRGHR